MSSLGSNIHDIEKVNKMDHHSTTLSASVNEVIVKFKDIEDHKGFRILFTIYEIVSFFVVPIKLINDKNE